MINIPIIILAAGSSSRLGRPKQLLEYQGETLLNRTIRIANEVSSNVCLVLGANFEIISKSILNKQCKIIFNENWQTGMASSITKSIEHYFDFEKLIIAICDQPFLNTNIFLELIEKSESSLKPIVASNYGNQLGVPILFNQLIYSSLQQLNGDKGARVILHKFVNDIAEIDFAKGELDVDTEEDWQRILNMV
jgi:molybdenum cofactor cytidylyltransferase